MSFNALQKRLQNIDTFVFDLDDTLYPQKSGVWAEIDQRISLYLKQHLSLEDEDALIKLRRYFRKKYGGALKGLIEEHQVDCQDYLQFVHDIDYSLLKPNPLLAKKIQSLFGKKYIFTNGDSLHAIRCLKALGLQNCFDGIFDIVAANYIPKPYHSAYGQFLNKFSIDAKKTMMVEDSLDNLQTCKDLGMTTIWINGKKAPEYPQYIDYAADTIDNFMIDMWTILDATTCQ